MHRSKWGIGDLFGIAGLVLIAVASGALFRGSSVVSVPDAAIAASAQTAQTSPLDSAAEESDPSATGALTPATPSTAGGTSSAAGRDDTPSAAAVPTEKATTTTSPPDATEDAGWNGLPRIGPSRVTQVRIPSIAVDAAVLPVDSTPTGETNAWGGPIYRTLDFPVDEDVRQWIRRGDPNTLPATEAAGDVASFDRVMLYGHASDIGNHLVFQDLSALKAHDPVVVTTELGTFVYRVKTVLTRAKANLDNLAALYDYPTGGAKEIALVACLPDTTSNVVVLGTLDRVIPARAAAPPDATTEPAPPDAG